MLQAGQLGSNFSSLLSTAPSLVFQPVNYTIDNLRPFDIQVYVASYSGQLYSLMYIVFSGTAIDFVGLIYLLILSVSYHLYWRCRITN